jgi:hypothetical protein
MGDLQGLEAAAPGCEDNVDDRRECQLAQSDEVGLLLRREARVPLRRRRA